MARQYSVLPDVELPIELGSSGLAAEDPITIGQMLRKTRDAYPDTPALASKEGEEWKKINYKEYYTLSLKAAKSLLKLGLEKFHSVAIIGFNSPEWFISVLGTIFAGGLVSGIYTTNNPETCQYIANDSKANIVIVENDMQLQKFLKIRKDLPHLKAIVQYKGKLSDTSLENVYEWDSFMKLGDETDDQVIEDMISAQRPSTCAFLVYTSGTTGEPKGVMLTHDNVTFAAKTIDATMSIMGPGDCVVSYLPLSHIAGLCVDLFSPINKGATTYFAQPDALKGSLAVTLREVQPHAFLGVPRVWEKFMEAIKGMLPPPGSGPPPTPEMMKAVTAKVLAGIGLSRSRANITAAAPISIEVLQFFNKLGIPIIEVWGMSELTGPGTTTTLNNLKYGSIGKPFIGTEVKIDKPDLKTGEGEILIHGRLVMRGYLNKLEKTKETIDNDGWVHSGDIGRMNEEGFFYITGRIKELIITAGGENIAPVPIEDHIKKHAPFISNAVLIGDKRKFISCLITLKVNMDPNTGAPTDKLLDDVVKQFVGLGSSATTVSQVLETKDSAVYSAIQAAIDKANEAAISSAQKVQKFVILKNDLSIPGGELGPTLKLKRFYVMSKYSEVIDDMYS